MEMKEFAKVVWTYEDVLYFDETVTQEDAEKFLKECEHLIHSAICNFGTDYLRELYLQWEVKKPRE